MQLPIGLTFNAHPDKTVGVENLVNVQPEATPVGVANMCCAPVLGSTPSLIWG